MRFLQDSIALFEGTRTSHMGAHQYVPHAGARHGKATSGDRLWAETEKRHSKFSSAMFNSEVALLKQAAADIRQFLPSGLPVVDLGPGTIQAFRNKVLPFMQALDSKRYIPVDESISFLRDLLYADDVRKAYAVSPLIDDFFENAFPYDEEAALVCSFGSTISNVEGPISEAPPEETLINGLRHLVSAANGGALLVAFDSSQNGQSIKNYYKLHALFQLNIFDRMAVELPMKDFDPLAFDYEPLWVPASGQLAHMAVVKKNMTFEIDGRRVFLEKGRKLHLKNSYKFSTELFNKACRALRLNILRVWENETDSKVYLLEIPSYAANKAQPLTDVLCADKASA